MHVIDTSSETWKAVVELCKAQKESAIKDALDSCKNFEDVLRVRGKVELIEEVLNLPEIQKRFVKTNLEEVGRDGF